MDLSRKRILIVKPSSLGDVVHTLPLVHAVKRLYPTCHIGWIVQQGFRGVLEHDPAVDEIITISIPSTSDPHARSGAWRRAATATFRTVKDLRARFRERPYDLVLDLHASFRSGLLALTNPGGMRAGFSDAKELNTLFQHHLVRPDPARPHAVDKNLAFTEFLACTPVADDFRVISGADARSRVLAFFSEEGIKPGARLVYANPAARWATKYWTVSGWAELADRLITDARSAVVFAGSPEDADHIRLITGAMKGKAAIAAGKLNLAEAVALIEASDVYVGVDSGPMHIAAFTGTPVVALFGPTDPAKVGPYGTGHRVVRMEDLDCLSCRKRSCEHRRCLEDLSSDRVYEETISLLGW